MASERVKEKAGEIKRDGWYCLLEYLLQKADCVLRLKVKSFWTSKTPMNYTTLSLPPPSSTLALQLAITPYLPPSLPSGLGLPVWMSLLCFVTCTCLRAAFSTWVVLGRNGIHLSPFCIETLLLPRGVSSPGIFPLFAFLTLLVFLNAAANFCESDRWE